MTHQCRHLRIKQPEIWISRFAPLFEKGGNVLDVACGGGRHTKLLLDLGLKVTALDLHTDIITERMGDIENLTIVTADLEDGPDIFGATGALKNQQFSGIVGVNYLHRELFPGIVNAIKPGGIFLYETFAEGNERFSKPRNPDHLLKNGELLDITTNSFSVIAYEHGLVNSYSGPGVRQRIAAIKGDQPQKLEDVDLSDF